MKYIYKIPDIRYYMAVCDRESSSSTVQYMREHLQTELSMLNVIVTLRGWGGGGVEAMTLRTIVGISCLILL